MTSFPPFRYVRTWRVAVISLLLLAAAVPAWMLHCERQAASAVSKTDLRSAEAWIARGSVVGQWRAETTWLTARIRRKQGRLHEFRAALSGATDRGLSSEVVQLEELLAEAQTGRLAGLERQLPTLLMQGSDLEEICEVFVSGCLMNYRLDDARRVLDIWRADYPDSARPLFLQSRIFEHADELSRAAEGYRQTLELNPRHGPAAFSLGRVLEQQNDLSGAYAAYRASREHLYHPEPAMVAMTRVLRQQNRLTEAMSIMDAAESLAGSPQERETAWMLAGATRRDAQTARLIEKAELDVALGRPNEAAEELRTVLSIAPRHWKLRYRYGLLLREQGRNEEAQRELKRYQDASEAMNRCDSLLARVRKNPADVDARFQIACEFLDHLSTTQGIVWLQTVLDLDAQHDGALDKLRSLNNTVAERRNEQ